MPVGGDVGGVGTIGVGVVVTGGDVGVGTGFITTGVGAGWATTGGGVTTDTIPGVLLI